MDPIPTTPTFLMLIDMYLAIDTVFIVVINLVCIIYKYATNGSLIAMIQIGGGEGSAEVGRRKMKDKNKRRISSKSR
jgi:hypothetical protein